MTKYLTNNFAVINLHKRPSSKSEVVTQMIYGDSFSISKKTKKWLNEMGNPYSKVGVDKNGSIAIDWGLYGIPETYVVDKNGIVQYKYIGPITKKTYKQFYSQIKKLKK